MINWSLLTARNVFAIAVMGLIAYFAFKYFTGKTEGGE